MRLAVLACAIALAASAAKAATEHWIGSWAAPPAMPMAAPPNSPIPGTPTFDNQTIVQMVRLSAGGTWLRLRLSNEYGTHALAIGAARVALISGEGALIAGSERAVTFSGGASAFLPPGAPLVSDPIALPTQALGKLRVSLFLPGDIHDCTCHMVGAEAAQLLPGDATAVTPAKLPTGGSYRAFLTEVDVETAAAAPVIVAFGDSITDGYRSTDGANRRWPDRLSERLVAAGPGRTFGLVNSGLSGNRVLSESLAIFGQNALARFDRDVLSIPGVTHLIVLEGVNDLGGFPAPSAETLIAGYRQLIARGHAHGVKVIGATILPYGGAAYYTAAGETQRQKVNAWIRSSHEFDGLVDFDAVTRDPAKPERMRTDLQSGDWLHPNDAGYRVMGDAVDLKLFR